MTRVLDALERAWSRSDALFDLLSDDALLEQPIPLRHPFLFYLGHLPAFAWNQVGRGLLDEPAFNPAFDELFEFGIDPLERNETTEGTRWPPPGEVVAYRDEIRRRMPGLAASVADRAAADVLAEGDRILHVVLEHELMHHETLMYMLAELAHDKKRAPDDFVPPAAAEPRDARVLEIPAGTVRLGSDPDAEPFCWDNEMPAHEVEVPAFRVDDVPVTNRRYLDFVDDGGYEDATLWNPGARSWARENGLEQPHGWTGGPGERALRTPFADVPLDDALELPARVSLEEARAFLAWRTRNGEPCRLPTEAEWRRAAHGAPDGTQRRYPWGDDAPTAEHGVFDFSRWTAGPVGAHPAGASAFGAHDALGNGWEWTSTPFGPFPGFEAWVRTYPGYSRDFFDGKHFVMLGGSWATDAALLRPGFRNWFQARYPYVFSAFRCAYDA